MPVKYGACSFTTKQDSTHGSHGQWTPFSLKKNALLTLCRDKKRTLQTIKNLNYVSKSFSYYCIFEFLFVASL